MLKVSISSTPERPHIRISPLSRLAWLIARVGVESDEEQEEVGQQAQATESRAAAAPLSLW